MLYKLSKLVNSSMFGLLIRRLIDHLPIFVKPKIFATVISLVLNADLRKQHVRIYGRGDALVVIRKSENKEIKLSMNHMAYLRDMVRSFDYYFESVDSENVGGGLLVDFSLPRDHWVNGFDSFPIHLPSLAEPISTNNQYIAFGSLKPGDVVIDLGAYAGLSSIMFKEVVGEKGIVVAVEADSKNISSLRINLNRYTNLSGCSVEVVEAAIWNHSDGISFTSDGNMGSSATEILGGSRGISSFIQTMTLSDLADNLRLSKVNLIKCDIEGGELAVFKDVGFFKRFRPRIIIEPHFVNGELTSRKVIEDLRLLDYTVREVNQSGVDYPLLECIPN